MATLQASLPPAETRRQGVLRQVRLTEEQEKELDEMAERFKDTKGGK